MRQKFLQAGVLALILAALLSVPGPAQAAGEEAGGNLSLDQAIGVALKEHPSVKQFRENMAASREGIGVARATYFPQANFVGQYSYGNSFSSSGALSHRFHRRSTGGSTGGLRHHSLACGNALLFLSVSGQPTALRLRQDPGNRWPSPGPTSRAREQDYFGTRQQVVLDLRTAYFGYLAARRAMKVQEETVRQNQELTKQAQGFYQVGLKAKIDVTKAEANLYQAEANLIRAKNDVELARVTLMNALGIKTWPYKDVEDVLEVTPQPRPLEELLAQATERRPEIQKNRFQQEFSQAAIKVARAGYFPSLFFHHGLWLAEHRSAIFQPAQQLVRGRLHDLPALQWPEHQYSVARTRRNCAPPWKITRCCARTPPRK